MFKKSQQSELSNTQKGILLKFFGEAAGEVPWAQYRRQGKVFCLVKLGEDAPLKLYQPKKVFGKLWKFFVTRCAERKIAFPGKKANLGGMGSSVVDNVERGLGGKCVEILFGNTDHGDERLIVRVDCPTGQKVVKLGFDEGAKRKIEHERGILKKLTATGRADSLPLTWESHDGGVSAFATALLPRQWDWNTDKLLKLLSTWTGSEQVDLGSSLRWPLIEKAFRDFGVDKDVLTSVEEWRCSRALVHGDLASWNVMQDDDGLPKVIDWECAEFEGIAGVDLVHWFFQYEFYVKGLSSLQSAENVFRRLEAQSFRAYLQEIGWADRLHWLMAVYFSISKHLPNEDRRGLVLSSINQFDKR